MWSQKKRPQPKKKFRNKVRLNLMRPLKPPKKLQQPKEKRKTPREAEVAAAEDVDKEAIEETAEREELSEAKEELTEAKEELEEIEVIEEEVAEVEAKTGEAETVRTMKASSLSRKMVTPAAEVEAEVTEATEAVKEAEVREAPGEEMLKVPPEVAQDHQEETDLQELELKSQMVTSQESPLP